MSWTFFFLQGTRQLKNQSSAVSFSWLSSIPIIPIEVMTLLDITIFSPCFVFFFHAKKIMKFGMHFERLGKQPIGDMSGNSFMDHLGHAQKWVKVRFFTSSLLLCRSNLFDLLHQKTVFSKKLYRHFCSYDHLPSVESFGANISGSHPWKHPWINRPGRRYRRTWSHRSEAVSFVGFFFPGKWKNTKEMVRNRVLELLRKTHRGNSPNWTNVFESTFTKSGTKSHNCKPKFSRKTWMDWKETSEQQLHLTSHIG